MFLDESELPPAPIFTMLTTAGVLCAYQMINKFPNIKHDILTKPVPLTSGTVRRGTEELITKLPQPFSKQETLDEKPPVSFTLEAAGPPKETSIFGNKSFSFGTTSQAQNLTSDAPKPFTFGGTATETGFPSQSQTPKDGFSFGTSEQAPVPGISQKQPVASTFAAGGFSFGTSQQQPPSSTKNKTFSFGGPKPEISSSNSQKPEETIKPAAGGFSFGTPQQTQASSIVSQNPDEAPKPLTGGFSFDTPQQPPASSVTSQKPDEVHKPAAGGFSFGTPQQTPVSLVISQKPDEAPKPPAAGGFSLGGLKQTPATGGFSFSGSKQTPTSSVISQKPDEAPKPFTGGFNFGTHQQSSTSELNPFTPNKTASSVEVQSQLPIVSISTNAISVQPRASVAESE